MKPFLLFITGAMAFCLLTGSSVQPAERFWKGNLHTHSYWSDGNNYPEAIAKWYKTRGYNFLAFTEHNTLQEGEKWSYRNTGDSVRLLELKDYRIGIEEAGKFLLLSGEEVSDVADGKSIHLNGINLNQVVLPAGGSTVTDCMMKNYLAIKEVLIKTGTPEWITINHPNYGWSLKAHDLADSKARFFEVYSGHPTVRNYGDAQHPGTEKMWDMANKWRVEEELPLLYGTAVDDAHHFNIFETGKSNPGRGWVMVWATDLNPQSLYRAMNKGNFYASTGVIIKDFVFSKTDLRLELQGDRGFNYTIEFIGWLPGESEPKVLKTINGTSGSYKPSGQELFVRVRVISNKQKENPYAEGDVEMAWLQPVRIIDKESHLP